MLALFALGELRLETDAGEVLSRRRKPLVLLIYLVRRAPRTVSRVELAALLWGERPEAKARQSLRQALLELHRLVGDRLVVTAESVRVVADDIALDASLFEDDVEAGRNREAIARWAGGFCEGAEEGGESAFRTWADAENAGLLRCLTLAFERLLDDAARRGDGRESIEVARRWTTLSPLDEHACLRLITALRREGRSVDALARHTSFVARLREELDVAPSRAFMQLAHSLDESARTPPPRPASPRPRDDEPTPPSTLRQLVGRGAAFIALTSAWSDARDGKPGVVIVRAARGMGASRLCEEFARWVKDDDASAQLLHDEPGRARRHDTAFAGAGAILHALHDAPALGGIAPEMLASLAAIVPEIARRFHHLPRPVDASVATASLAVAEALDAIAEDSPVLLVVDRLDGFDEASDALFQQVASRVTGGVLVVIVAGPGDEALRTLQDRLADAPSVTSLELDPLQVDQVVELLDVATSLRGDEMRRFAESMRIETGGIPAFLIPLVDSLLEHGSLSRAGARTPPLPVPDPTTAIVPSIVRRWMQHRRDALPESARRLLDAVVVFDRPLTGAAAAQLVNLSALETAEEFEQLARADLVQDDAKDGYALAPPIAQRTLYDLMPPLRREALHATAMTLAPRERAWLAGGGEDRVAHHMRRANLGSAAPSRARPRKLVAGIVISVLVAAAAAAIWLRPPATPIRDAAVAIFPFGVNGDPKLRFLEAGMVDLLSTSLDGAAGLRTIDPRAVISAAQSAPGTTPVTLEHAHAIAERLGARFFVLGSVLGAGGRLEVSATLYRTNDASGPVARASAAGGSDGLFDIVDRVTAQLAVAHGSPSGERLTQLAAVTTSSLDALKAFLEARSAYRANNLYAAIPAYQRAVAADSTFALAWFGLASAASWMLRPGIEQHAAAQAVKFSGPLSARDRMLLEGFAAYSRGAADSAERVATSLAESYDDVEAWVLLGEVLYHHNFKRGRSATESRHAWERVLALDPRYWPALQHLAEVAAFEGNAREADSLLAQYERSVGTEHMMMASRALRAYAYGDEASRAAVEPQLASDRGFWLIASVWYVSVFGRDLDDARRIARLLVDPLRPSEQQGFGRVLLAHLALARGQWREARAELAIAYAHAPADALEHRILLSLFPMVATPASALDVMRADLERLPAAPSKEPVSAIPWPRTPMSMQPMIRAYLAGLLSARTGDEAGRVRALERLAAAPDPSATSALGQGFALSIRAEHERAARRPAAALAALEQGARATPFVSAWTSSIVSQGYERFLRAELLHELKRDDEALRWYSTIAENSPYDLVYLAPSLYRQAQIHEARGQRALAAQRYARFLELWKDCDEELRPLTTDARTRLARLR